MQVLAESAEPTVPQLQQAPIRHPIQPINMMNVIKIPNVSK